jgi:HK97 family phage major capsid protein
MASNDLNAWIQVEQDSTVMAKVNAMSITEDLAVPVPMGADTRSVPRDYGVSDLDVIDRGGTYSEDSTGVGDVDLKARKFGKILSFYDEDLADSPVEAVNRKLEGWARAYAIGYDNATIATTGAMSSSATAGKFPVPFNSLAYTLLTADSNLSYAASANYTVTGSGGPTYTLLSAALGKVETGSYWEEGSMFVAAHTSYRAVLREILDLQNKPIFIETGGGTPDTLFNIPIKWGLGLRTSGVQTSAPTGRPLLVFGNRNYLLKGMRSGPESMAIDVNGGNTDEPKVKARARRGFGVGFPQAFAILENQKAGA